MSGTILLSRSVKGGEGHFNSNQLRMDAVLEGITKEGLAVKSLLPMFAASFAFKFSRLAILGINSSKFAQGASYGFALLGEASAFDFTSRLLSSSSSENALDFSHRIVGNMFRFGILRGSHVFVNPANPILSHFVTSSAMVSGEAVAASLGFGIHNSASLFEQLVQAETSNIQMQFSMASLNFLFPSISSREAALQVHEKTFTETYKVSEFSQAFAFMNSAEGDIDSSRILFCPSENVTTPVEPASMKRTWRRLNENLKATEKIFEENLSAEAIQITHPDPRDVHAVWFHQMKDFITGAGGTWRLRSSYSLLEPLHSKEKWKDAKILEDSLRPLKEQGLEDIADQILEFEIPYEQVKFGFQREGAPNAELAYLLGQMEGNLSNLVRLVGNPFSQKKIVGRVPSLLLMESLQKNISGERFTPYVFVRGRISRDLIVRIRSRGFAPIGISRTPPFLGDIGVKVHPWFFTFHDVYHALELSEYAAEFRSFIGQHYERLKENRLFRSSLMQTHLDCLVDFDPSIDREGRVANYFRYSFNYVWSEILSGEPDVALLLHRMLQHNRFWFSYLAWMKESMPVSVRHALFHIDLQRELEMTLRKLDEQFKSVVDMAKVEWLKSKKTK